MASESDRLIALAHRILREEWARIESSPEWQAKVAAEELRRRAAEWSSWPRRARSWADGHRLELVIDAVLVASLVVAAIDLWYKLNSRRDARRPRPSGGLAGAES